MRRGDYTPSVEETLNFFHPDDQETARSTLGRAIAEGSHAEFELRLIRADGEQRTVICRAVCERGPATATSPR